MKERRKEGETREGRAANVRNRQNAQSPRARGARGVIDQQGSDGEVQQRDVAAGAPATRPGRELAVMIGW